MTQTMEIVSYSSSILMLIKKQKIEFLDDEIPHMITLSSPHHTSLPLQKTRLRLMDEII